MTSIFSCVASVLIEYSPFSQRMIMLDLPIFPYRRVLHSPLRSAISPQPTDRQPCTSESLPLLQCQTPRGRSDKYPERRRALVQSTIQKGPRLRSTHLRHSRCSQAHKECFARTIHRRVVSLVVDCWRHRKQ